MNGAETGMHPEGVEITPDARLNQLEEDKKVLLAVMEAVK